MFLFILTSSFQMLQANTLTHFKYGKMAAICRLFSVTKVNGKKTGVYVILLYSKYTSDYQRNRSGLQEFQDLPENRIAIWFTAGTIFTLIASR
ncbi:hypothetical protein A7S16_23840 [Salmonella enterica]|nr:hypothetical protein A7S11_23435 [Salmonella enterica]OHK89356.1 hypothetical protein A7S86_23285 [Salmonella enterica subsp. enterica serovar Rubislaw]OHI10517.1 hypothetical protein A7S13_24025 [Salmonella enterica]OHI14563.1 hypothetical protein A7S14_23705 [Salmonella enterica]OHI19643.1 hypothetical protein A7S15_23830 [Salmonella enterica]